MCHGIFGEKLQAVGEAYSVRVGVGWGGKIEGRVVVWEFFLRDREE